MGSVTPQQCGICPLASPVTLQGEEAGMVGAGAPLLCAPCSAHPLHPWGPIRLTGMLIYGVF